MHPGNQPFTKALAALLACLALACLGGAAVADMQVETLYAVGPAYGPLADWQNTDTVFGPPTGDCNDGTDPQYAWNDVGSSTEWIEIQHWDVFELLAGCVISKAEINGNGRYNEMPLNDSDYFRVGSLS